MVRSLMVFAVIGLVLVVLADWFLPQDSEQGEFSVVAVVTVLGMLASFQVLRSIGRTHPAAWRRVGPLWRRSTPPSPFPSPDSLKRWEALLTLDEVFNGGIKRDRDQLSRHVDPLVDGCLADCLADRVPAGELPSADQLLDAIDQLLTETEDNT